MNIAVCIKQTPDTEAAIRIAPGDLEVVESDLQWVISPHDETAVEQALRLSESSGGTVVVFSVGPPRVETAIREALAMGADRGVRLACERMPRDPACIAHALTEVLQGYDLIFMGEQAIDGAGAQVPQRVAGGLGLPCVTAVEELHIEGTECQARRVLEGREERVHFCLPAVIGVNRRLMEPRYPSFRGIMRAKKKPIDLQDALLGEDAFDIQKLRLPPKKAAGQLFTFDSEVPALVARLLREEAKVI